MQEKAMAIQATLQKDTSRSTYNQVNVAIPTTEEANKKALRAMGFCLLAALLSVFIPIGHFFLVPAFLVAAAVSYFALRKPQVRLEEGAVVCPDCQKRTAVSPGPAKFPLQVTCDHCRSGIDVKEKATD